MSSLEPRFNSLVATALAVNLPPEHPLATQAAAVLARITPRLQQNPTDPLALAELIALQLEVGQAGLAAELNDAALGLWPEQARFHYLRGRSQRALGALEAAIQAYRQATALDPSFVDAWVSLGLAYKQAGHLSDAQDALIEANRLAPARADIFINLGHLAAQRLAWNGALESYRNALVLNPHSDAARLGLARVLTKCNHYAEALQEWSRLTPAWAASFMGQRVLARARYLAGDIEACRLALIAALEAGLKQGIDSLELHRELIKDCELPDACSEVLAALLQRLPDSLALQRLYVDGLIGAFRFDEAMQVLGLPQSLASLDDVFIDSLFQLASLCPDTSLTSAIVNELLVRQQRHPALAERLELSYLFYKLGRFAEAAPAHLRRRKSSDDAFRGGGHERPRLWRGESLEGRSLVLWREQGLGDTLQMLRFLPQLRALAPRELAYVVTDELVPLLRACPEVDRVLTLPSEAASMDYHLPDMNCLALFVQQEADIPNAVPYLRLARERVAHWRERLGPPDQRLCVAIAWAGNPNLDQDRARSIPTQELAPLGELPGIRWISVQKGPLRALTQGPLPFQAEYYAEELTDLAETGALLACVDCVVSVDTAVAHLAGALGRPVFLLNRFISEYRWQIGRIDSPWYPTLRLFNQRRAFDWSEPLQELRAVLEAECAKRD